MTDEIWSEKAGDLRAEQYFVTQMALIEAKKQELLARAQPPAPAPPAGSVPPPGATPAPEPAPGTMPSPEEQALAAQAGAAQSRPVPGGEISDAMVAR